MADEHSEKMVRLLEEIRDLTKQRLEQVEALGQKTLKRADETRQRYSAQEARAKKRFYVSIAAVCILGLMFFVVIILLMMPRQ
jgi:Flp pilus assembly protein TadB